MQAIDDMTLGETETPFKVSDSTQAAAGIAAMASQARRAINIFTRHLDHKIYDSQALYDAVLQLATSSRHAQVRIILLDSKSVVRRGSRLVRLSQRLSSRIQIRKPPMEYMARTEELFTVDNHGIFFRSIGNRYEGQLHFNAPMDVRQHIKFFDDCWEKSAADPELTQHVL